MFVSILISPVFRDRGPADDCADAHLAYCFIFVLEGKELARLVLGLYILPEVLALTVELMFQD